MPMIKPKFTFFQMEIKSVLLHSPETNQASLGIGPKAFYPINVAMFIGKFIFSVLHSVMLLVANIYKTIIATPTIRMNNTFRVYTAPNNALQRSSGAIRDYFGINTALPLKKAKNNCFSSGPATSDTLNPACSEVAFVNLNLALHGRFSFAGKGNSFSNSLEQPVGSVSV